MRTALNIVLLLTFNVANNIVQHSQASVVMLNNIVDNNVNNVGTTTLFIAVFNNSEWVVHFYTIII